MIINGIEVFEKTCTKCEITQDVCNFSINKKNTDGSVRYLCSWCKNCKNKHEIDKRGGRVKPIPLVSENQKECLDCGILKSTEDFSPASRGRLGRASYCRDCANIRVKNLPNKAEKHREYVKSYRKRHQNRWRAMHRIHQFNRVSLIKATDDGTVTDEFLAEIYNKEECFWCKSCVLPENRTLEHIQELSEGGVHSSRNITMACSSCNSARKGNKYGRGRRKSRNQSQNSL